MVDAPGCSSWRAEAKCAIATGRSGATEAGGGTSSGAGPRRVVPALLAGLCLGVAGCGDMGQITDGLSDKPTPPMTAREPLAPGSAGLSWTAPASIDGEWTIGPQGIGPLLVQENPLAESAASASEGVAAAAAASPRCIVVTPPSAPPGVVAWNVGSETVALVASQPGPRTLGGITVGSEASELQRHYGDRLSEGEGPNRGWRIVEPPPTLVGYPIAFEIQDGVVRRIRVGMTRPVDDCR